MRVARGTREPQRLRNTESAGLCCANYARYILQDRKEGEEGRGEEEVQGAHT